MISSATSTRFPVGGDRILTVAALLLDVAALAMAVFGLRLLFAGRWLESHDVRYVPLAMLGAAVLAVITAIALGIVGVARRPRAVGSWVVAGLTLLALPACIAVAAFVGI